MPEVASAFVTIAPSAKGFGTSLNRQVGPGVTSAGRSVGRMFGKAFLATAALAATGVGLLLKGSIDEAREAQKVAAATEQIIKSTGGAARITAKDVGLMSSRLSAVTGIDDEAIQTGANLLLTFKNIKNFVDGQFTGTFDRATAAAVDLSAAGFGSIESASKSMGKALDDPVKGVTALARAGVTFTEQQKEQIKTMVESGNVLGAQNIILKEVESQVGGVAEATATSGEKAQVAFDNLKEQIGTALLPVVDRLATTFTTKIAPAISTFISNLQSGKGAAGSLGNFIRESLVPALGQIASFIQTRVVPVYMQWMGFLVSDVLPVLRQFGNYLVTRVVPAIRDALVPVIAAAKREFNKIRDSIRENKPQLTQLFNAFKKVADFILTKMIPSAIQIARVTLPILGAAIRLIINAAAFWVQAFQKVKAAFETVKDAISTAIGKVTEFAAAVRQKVSNVISTVKGIPGRVKSALGNLGSLLVNAGKALIQGLIDGITSKIGALKDKLGEITKLIPKGKGPPAKDRVLLYNNGKLIMDGLIDGIRSREKALNDALAKVGKKVKEQISKIRDQLATARSDFASLVDPIASAFTSNLFEATNAKDFLASLTGTKGQLRGLIDAFKTLIAQGLSPGFLYQLFQSGNAGLILDLAKNPALAAEAGAVFGDVMNLSDQLGNAVAGATDKGAALEKQTVRLEKKLQKLIDHGNDNTDRMVQALGGPARARRRARMQAA